MLTRNLIYSALLCVAALVGSCSETRKVPAESRPATSYGGAEALAEVADRAATLLPKWRRVPTTGELARFAGTIFDPTIRTAFEARCARNKVWRAALAAADLQTSETRAVSVAGRSTITAWIRDRANERVYLVGIDPASEFCAGVGHNQDETHWSLDGDMDIAAVLAAQLAIDRSIADPSQLHASSAAKEEASRWLQGWAESAVASDVAGDPDHGPSTAGPPDDSPPTPRNAVLSDLAARAALTPEALQKLEEGFECSDWWGKLVCESVKPSRELCLGGHSCERIGYLFTKEGKLQSARMVLDGAALDLELLNALQAFGEPELRVNALQGPCHSRETATFHAPEGSLGLERVKCSATVHAYYGSGGAVIAELPTAR